MGGIDSALPPWRCATRRISHDTLIMMTHMCSILARRRQRAGQGGDHRLARPARTDRQERHATVERTFRRLLGRASGASWCRRRRAIPPRCTDIWISGSARVGGRHVVNWTAQRTPCHTRLGAHQPRVTDKAPCRDRGWLRFGMLDVFRGNRLSGKPEDDTTQIEGRILGQKPSQHGVPR